MPNTLSLKNKWIVITRPEHQTHRLSKMLQKVGGCPIPFPLIEIEPNVDLVLIRQQLNQLHNYDLIIFVSTNAVELSLNSVDIKKLDSTKIASTGKKTAQALAEKGINIDFCPERIFNSEALLAIPSFQQFAKGKKIAIIRGEGGRDFLRQNLVDMNADVDYIDVYKRDCPQNSLESLKHFWKRNELDIILLTSGSSASSFFSLAKNEPWINELTLLLGSHRIQQKIPEQFRGKIVIAEDPSDETIYQKLISMYG